jgi:hypothetical protein
LFNIWVIGMIKKFIILHFNFLIPLFLSSAGSGSRRAQSLHFYSLFRIRDILIRILSFYAYSFFMVHLHHSSKKKVIKKSQKWRNQGFSSFFCLMMEGSGSRRQKIYGSGFGTLVLLLFHTSYRTVFSTCTSSSTTRARDSTQAVPLRLHR